MAHKVVLASASPSTNTLTHWYFPEDNTQDFAEVWGPSTWMLSTKRQLGAALKISDSSLKSSHPRAEASVVVCTGARPLDKDCFSSQNLTCVCSDWMPILPLNLPACNAQTAFLYRMDTSISLGWFQPWPWTSLQKQRRRTEVFENRRGNNQHNRSTTVQLKGRDCTRWTGEKF